MLNSLLSSEIADYIRLRYAFVSVSTANADEKVLDDLDEFLVKAEVTDKELTEEILTDFIATLTGKSKTIYNKVGTIRGFTRFLNALGYTAFIPDVPTVKSDFMPYIYSNEEIQKIFYYADRLPLKQTSHKRPYHTIKVPMILRILYGCGTRIGETVAIKRSDIDFQNRTLFLRETKNSKERLIPIHDSLNKILFHYCVVTGIMEQPDAYLFPGMKSGTHYTTRQVVTWFSEILKLANIDQWEKSPNKRGACLHSFRHLFVLKAIKQLETAGRSVDMNDLLLPTYLGHECLLDTDKYMRFSGVQVSDSLDAFETFSSGLIPSVEVPYEE